MPQRSLLCLKRSVDESGAWAFTYLASQPPSEQSAPDCDFAVPFA
jgi:hypothetical protein